MQKIAFKRCLRSGNSIGDTTLVIFREGSQKAFEIYAYAKRKLSNGKWKIHLIATKGKIAPVKKISAMTLTWWIPQIVKAMLQKKSFGFNTFVDA